MPKPPRPHLPPCALEPTRGGPSSTGSAFRAAAPSPTGGASAAAPSSTGGPLFFLALEVLRPSPNSAEPYPGRIGACAAEATCAPPPERGPFVDLRSPAALRQIEPTLSFPVTSSSSPTHSPCVLASPPPGRSRCCSPLRVPTAGRPTAFLPLSPSRLPTLHRPNSTAVVPGRGHGHAHGVRELGLGWATH
ncbi:nascent polypeptide-associated complex subunit alpha, muscle-specific form-like [Panicum virgatum]|uniref:nascent polypeptide-associated complex subunit alpha, muscle-specific form-like n=1 Tax=Panicum virgatum TaxID=38727 RepID=UPI0019D69FFA|nr:nascent polypeptide-associated complex subunit alpha, muscle-specific form-like [Panicum virgatum]